MKTCVLTIRLDEDLDNLLMKVSCRLGTSRSDVAREALRRQLHISEFESLWQRMMPFAEAGVVGTFFALGQWHDQKKSGADEETVMSHCLRG